MSAPRALNLALRRIASPAGLTKFSPAGRLMQQRFAATTTISEKEAVNSILAKQRLNRPVSPHLTIYKPQMTWLMSGLTRITGLIVATSFYVYGLSYLAAPTLGWHLETPSLVAAVAAWPVVVKVTAKLAIAVPFFYHSFNGVRHLVWDFGKGMTNQAVVRGGWVVIALTAASSLWATFLA
ncbi:mitochondrial succinate dehydrogenase cytochrome b560 subunit C [Mytilinidion resinicola]|uniref:Mitochondrial succinate dehydrogenase cytochrome b560 subunit C n=1 Tax=Mytilinidion resinicola TaxID=574789 RepID=A0A6A6Z5X6_9PEZI|nr:mitochondrial succinate dehydrogenase cytochrome b560 subunit C [Mytilinidion resinicola]KAF2816430.1 mitochondrial succinate dehydrogenase cytochrome b560 subunit C [Mytilinidion resinicola]